MAGSVHHGTSKSRSRRKRLRRALLQFLRRRHDFDVRLELLASVGRWLFPNYRLKWPQLLWWEDEAFDEYLARFGEEEGFNADRRWMVYQLQRLTAGVPGETAECGVFQGAGSYLIVHANANSPGHARHHHVFDSFEGLSDPSGVDGEHWSRGAMACSLEVVQNNLVGLPNVSYYAGWIPQRFAEVADKSFAFVHVDVDLYQPTRDSLEFFYPRLSPGGVLVCDDYRFTSCPGATRAVDEFFAGKPESMVSLSGGGGFVVKGVTTAAESLAGTAAASQRAA